MRLFGLEITRARSQPAHFLGDLVKVDLAPGDVCVLMARRKLTPDETQMMGAAWRATVGDDVTLILLDDGTKIGVLSPPQAVAVQETLADQHAVAQAVGA